MNTYKSHFSQFFKFAVTGVANTAVDFGILNILIFSFGVTVTDFRYPLFKLISSTLAIINSYVLNRFWVFKNNRKTKLSNKEKRREIATFLAVSLTGVVINVGIAFISFHLLHTAFPAVSDTYLANIGALSGIIIVLITNFLGYKFFVFTK